MPFPILRLTLLLACAASLPAQDVPTLSLGAQLVTLPVVVRDKQGNFTSDLARDNFLLKVDGQPQPIRYFDHDTDLPLTLGLLVDTSMSQISLLADERSASRLFLDKMLAPADQAFVMQFDKRVLLLQPLTSDRPLLESALGKVDTPHPDLSRASSDTGFERMRAARTAIMAVVGTKLFDAVVEASHSLASKPTSRRALILLTDGGDHGSAETLQTATEAAQRADTALYAIYYVASPGANRDLFRDAIRNPPPPSNFLGSAESGQRGGLFAGDGGKNILERMTSETGGKVFEVSGKQTVAQIYARIAEELRAQYRIGFTPSAATAAEGYHRLQLTLTGPESKGKHTLQTREGYYAPKPR